MQIHVETAELSGCREFSLRLLAAGWLLISSVKATQTLRGSMERSLAAV
jgi:hypothetical protein